MIINDGNRYKSVRTDQEIADMFTRDYDSLGPEEKEIFNLILEDFKVGGKSPIFECASRIQYRCPPCEIDKFLNDSYFIGDHSRTLFPAWKEVVKEIFSGGYEEVILGGSTGAGKTSVAVMIMLRMLYEVGCLANPHKTYEIASSDRIAFPIISVTEAAATEAYLKLCESIKGSQWFKENFWPTITDSNGIVFPNHIWIPPPGSNVQSFIGTNAFGGLIDESNFFKKIQNGPVTKDYIKDIYDSIKQRIENRFMRNGRVPGMLILVSSKADPDSFTEKRIRDSMNDPKVFVVEKAAYEIHPIGRYSGKTFKVAIGNDFANSRILTDLEEAPEKQVVISVPEEFRKAFERDVDKAIREVSGYATISITPYLHDRRKIKRAIDPTRVHPFSVEVWDQTYPAEVKWDLICDKTRDGSWKPKLNPGRPRHVHFDLSKNKDSTSMCIGHIGGWKEVQRIGADENEYAPNFIVDFILKIKPPVSGKEIVYSELRKLVYQFSQHGFYINLITADQYQSVGFLQTLEQQGYHTKTTSVDRLGPYDILKAAFYDERISYYNYPPLEEELKKLEKNWKTGKVDHPQHGAKDASDSICGVVATLSEAAVSQTPFIGQEMAKVEVEDNDEAWILGSAIAVEKNSNNNQTDWRQEAEKKKSEQEKFNMPFLMG